MIRGTFLAVAAATGATLFQKLGALAFGVVIGWYLYFVSRYRSDTVKLADVASVAGALGGTAVLALFPAGTDLLGAYGIGVFVGFFGYFTTLMVLVARSENFDSDWFLDGRRRALLDGETSEGAAGTSHVMESRGQIL